MKKSEIKTTIDKQVTCKTAAADLLKPAQSHQEKTEDIAHADREDFLMSNSDLAKLSFKDEAK